MEILKGSIERITYFNEDNGYTVLRLKSDNAYSQGEGRDGLVTVTGNLPELAPGEYLQLKGEWVNHPKHGLQFNTEVIEQSLPATLEGLRKYLGSGLLVGIGPKIAEAIVKYFGLKTIDIIENHPSHLRDVPDIGPKRMKVIVKAWEEQKQVKEIMIFLHSQGITTNLAVKIYSFYGNKALEIVKADPYRLARDLHGVGFKTADKIAQAMGLPKDHPTRIEAGLLFVLEEMNRQGNVFSPRGILEEKAAELLNVEINLTIKAIERLAEAELIILDSVPLVEGKEPEKNNAVYLPAYYYAELGTANRLKELANATDSRLSANIPIVTQIDDTLSPEQAEAINTVLIQPVTVLTGGPGTGKTTAIKALIAAVEGDEKRYALVSPTGRAAKRLSEAAERPASTIHRLLDFSPTRGFIHNAENPLKLDLIVVDEVSMLDVLLANSLFKALETGTHVLLVGDIDQLPSVGAGDVLRDIIASKIVPVIRLSVIFRQAKGSDIISNAHRVNQGKLPNFGDEGNDFFRFPADTPEKAAEWVEDLIINRIPKRFGYKSADIQVLVPMYRGPAGITALNERLQNALNPGSILKAERKFYGQTFRPGDKVMQTRNDYEKKVFNGDIGFITELSSVEHTLTVDFEGRHVVYTYGEADQLVLAYAVSVHKSQGSEFPVIIMPLLTQHYMMLQRNLLYTAITRAKKLCILVTNSRTLSIAVKNNKVAERYSWLDGRLQTSMKEIL